MIEQGSELRSSTLKRAPDHCVLSSSDPVLSSNMVAVLENIFPLGLGQRWGIRLAKVLPRAARVGEQHTCATVWGSAALVEARAGLTTVLYSKEEPQLSLQALTEDC